MTDRELLEKAAKAAGIAFHSSNNAGLYIGQSENDFWQPLADDGDALRLAVKLKMSVTVFGNAVGIGIKGDFGYREYEIGTDPQAATRRAIVRAAATLCE